MTHIQNQQAAVGDTSFDDLFEQVGTDLLDDVADWTDPLPSGRAAPEELFDGQVEGTPRYEIGVNLIRTITARTNSARRRFDNGWLALTLMDLYGLENERRTLETIEERVENGELGRPESDEEILEAKQAALREIESILENPRYPYLVTRQVAGVLQTIRSADWGLENYHSDEGAVQSLGEFELAAERARKIPATTSWFVETLDQT